MRVDESEVIHHGGCEKDANHNYVQPGNGFICQMRRVINNKASEQSDRADEQVHAEDELQC